MKPERLDTSGASDAKKHSLERVLRRSRKVKVAIKHAAGRLAAATAVLKRRKSANLPAQSIEQAINKYEEVEGEVVAASHDLTQVNTDLAVEVAERVGIESELADTKADLADTKVDLATVRDDLAESQANEDDARQRALQDPLTGLPNRALFDQGLDHGLIQARRHDWGLAILFIDIDDFKGINDSYGHHVGDEVLMMIADRLRGFVRGEDMVSRRGGDEFVCLLLEVDEAAEVTRLARNMCTRIGEEFQSGETTLSVGCSIGIAMYPGDGESAEALLNNADEAMYRAKMTPQKVVLFGAEQS